MEWIPLFTSRNRSGMFKKAAFVPLVLFCFSSVFPYVQMLLVPRTLSMMPLANDFVALVVLAVASIALAVGAKQNGYGGRGLLYPAAAVLAVVGYCYGLDALQYGGDYLDFRSRKARLEAHVATLQTSPTARAAAVAATATVRQRGYPGLGEGGRPLRLSSSWPWKKGVAPARRASA